MIGIEREVMEKVLKNVQEAEIDTDSLVILSSGVENIVVRVTESNDNNEYILSAKTNGFAGPEIDVDALKQELVGARYSEAINIIEGKPGVKDAEVEFSPFWVSSIPGIDKTDVEIEIDDSLLQ
jgi:HSP20 family molecular chaperone IbpA